MAIGNRNERFSCINIGLPFGRVLPNPDGNLIGTPDRQQSTMRYRIYRSDSRFKNKPTITFEVSI